MRLEQECTACSGYGYDYGPYCACRGTGYELTEDGDTVLALLERHFRRLLKDNLPDQEGA